MASTLILDPDILTPVERWGDIYVKRDDLFTLGSVCGGKARTAWSLMRFGYPLGFVTAGSRQSPQVAIVATLAQKLGKPCEVHVPAGALSPETERAAAAGANVVYHRPGYNTVITARAKQAADEKGWRYIPFGMEHLLILLETREQVRNLPLDIKRVVMTVGSGMSLAGVLQGLALFGPAVRLLGVVVGAKPHKRLDQYAPLWRFRVDLAYPAIRYGTPAKETNHHGLELDPIYEAKCLPFLQPGDLLWVVGNRQGPV